MSYTLPPARSRLTVGKIFWWTACIALVALMYWRMMPSTAKEIVGWRTDLSVARAEAEGSQKLIFADFTASWCGPCQSIRRVLWSDPGVARALGAFVPVQVDIDQSHAIAEQYQIEAIPAFLVLDQKGHVLRRSEGAMEKSEFLDWLKH